jgi:hypothetical protein
LKKESDDKTSKEYGRGDWQMVQVQEKKQVERQVQEHGHEKGQVENVDRKEFREAPVTAVFKKFGNNKDVSLVFGEPIEVGLTKVVPVAQLKYGFGGGGDGAGADGGGGGFLVKPVGVYEITPDRVRFKSTRNPLQIVGLVFMLGLSFFLGRNLRKKR